jgi:hypothetical protein
VAENGIIDDVIALTFFLALQIFIGSAWKIYFIREEI